MVFIQFVIGKDLSEQARVAGFKYFGGDGSASGFLIGICSPKIYFERGHSAHEPRPQPVKRPRSPKMTPRR